MQTHVEVAEHYAKKSDKHPRTKGPLLDTVVDLTGGTGISPPTNYLDT